MADKYLLEQFTKYINNRLEEYKIILFINLILQLKIY